MEELLFEVQSPKAITSVSYVLVRTGAVIVLTAWVVVVWKLYNKVK